MAKITRKSQKIFAGSANNDQIAKFGSMKTGMPVYSNDIETIQGTEYLEGWSDAILNDKAPYLEEMNGVQYAFSKQLAYLFQEGLPEYDANTTYYQYSIVKKPGTYKLFGSLINDNANTALTDTTAWVELIDLNDTVRARVVVEAYKNGARWYRVYDDKWCEQGGRNSGTVTFSKTFVDTDYSAVCSSASIGSKTTSTMNLSTTTDWVAMGYVS